MEVFFVIMSFLMTVSHTTVVDVLLSFENDALVPIIYLDYLKLVYLTAPSVAQNT
jgi:hypothetical protein